jgi:hypothetical protein
MSEYSLEPYQYEDLSTPTSFRVVEFLPREEGDEESKHAGGHAFGEPVCEFKYPESSFFITEGRLIGSTTRPGDMVCVALGSTYPAAGWRPFSYW